MASVANRLADGAAEDWFIAMGTSMRPTVRAVQRVHLRPVRATETLLDEVVLVRVDGRWWLHRVVEERSSRVLVAGQRHGQRMDIAVRGGRSSHSPAFAPAGT